MHRDLALSLPGAGRDYGPALAGEPWRGGGRVPRRLVLPPPGAPLRSPSRALAGLTTVSVFSAGAGGARVDRLAHRTAVRRLLRRHHPRATRGPPRPEPPHAPGTRFVCYMTACCNPCGCRRGRRIRGARATSTRRRPRSAWPASRPTCASRPGPSSRWPLRRGAGQEKWAAALVFLPSPIANTCVPTYGLPQELLLRRPPPSICLQFN